MAFSLRKRNLPTLWHLAPAQIRLVLPDPSTLLFEIHLGGALLTFPKVRHVTSLALSGGGKSKSVSG